MASVDVSQLSKAEHDELSCAYAALLLHDGEIEITVSLLTSNEDNKKAWGKTKISVCHLVFHCQTIIKFKSLMIFLG